MPTWRSSATSPRTPSWWRRWSWPAGCGKIARALTWQRAVTALAEEDVDDQWRRAPLETVISIAEESYLGRT